MQENASHTPRRWQRQASKIPISIVLEADHLKADDSAITVDVSPRGVGVRTKLALAPGEWVGVVAKGENPRSIPGLVAWVRKDESSQLTFAGLEFFWPPWKLREYTSRRILPVSDWNSKTPATHIWVTTHFYDELCQGAHPRNRSAGQQRTGRPLQEPDLINAAR